MGEIRAAEGEREIECLMIENPELVFELYERNILQKLLSQSGHLNAPDFAPNGF